MIYLEQTQSKKERDDNVKASLALQNEYFEKEKLGIRKKRIPISNNSGTFFQLNMSSAAPQQQNAMVNTKIPTEAGLLVVDVLDIRYGANYKYDFNNKDKKNIMEGITNLIHTGRFIPLTLDSETRMKEEDTFFLTRYPEYNIINSVDFNNKENLEIFSDLMLLYNNPIETFSGFENLKSDSLFYDSVTNLKKFDVNTMHVETQTGRYINGEFVKALIIYYQNLLRLYKAQFPNTRKKFIDNSIDFLKKIEANTVSNFFIIDSQSVYLQLEDQNIRYTNKPESILAPSEALTFPSQTPTFLKGQEFREQERSRLDQPEEYIDESANYMDDWHQTQQSYQIGASLTQENVIDIQMLISNNFSNEAIESITNVPTSLYEYVNHIKHLLISEGIYKYIDILCTFGIDPHLTHERINILCETYGKMFVINPRNNFFVVLKGLGESFKKIEKEIEKCLKKREEILESVVFSNIKKNFAGTDYYISINHPEYVDNVLNLLSLGDIDRLLKYLEKICNNLIKIRDEYNILFDRKRGNTTSKSATAAFYMPGLDDFVLGERDSTNVSLENARNVSEKTIDRNNYMGPAFGEILGVSNATNQLYINVEDFYGDNNLIGDNYSELLYYKLYYLLKCIYIMRKFCRFSSNVDNNLDFRPGIFVSPTKEYSADFFLGKFRNVDNLKKWTAYKDLLVSVMQQIISYRYLVKYDGLPNVQGQGLRSSKNTNSTQMTPQRLHVLCLAFEKGNTSQIVKKEIVAGINKLVKEKLLTRTVGKGLKDKYIYKK